MTDSYRDVAHQKAQETKQSIHVVAKGGSYLYLTFDDDFDWNEVLFVAKPE